MSALSAARLLCAGAAWRLTGVGATGRALVAAVADPRSDDRELAGILLVRAGDRSVPLVEDALGSGADPSELVNVLASIGTWRSRTALETAAASGGHDLSQAAREALGTWDEINRQGD
jgi:hypothetical protein